MIRYFKLSALLAFCAFSLAGCGGSGNSGGPTPPPTATPVSTATPVPTAIPVSNQFAGLYKGSTTFKNDRFGTASFPIEIRVNNDGRLQITFMGFGATSTATGSVDANGILTASYDNNSTARIIGRFARDGTGMAVVGNITTPATDTTPASSSTFQAKRE